MQLDDALIAITGTNGKTTTTLLVNHLLHASGIRSAAGGNVGGGLAPAASDLARLDDAPDWIVLEMSSFQLAGVDTFRPDIGVATRDERARFWIYSVRRSIDFLELKAVGPADIIEVVLAEVDFLPSQV